MSSRSFTLLMLAAIVAPALAVPVSNPQSSATPIPHPEEDSDSGALKFPFKLPHFNPFKPIKWSGAMGKRDFEESDLFARSGVEDGELFAREPQPLLPFAISQGRAGGYNPRNPHPRLPSRLSRRDLVDLEDIVAREYEDVFARSFDQEDLMSRDDGDNFAREYLEERSFSDLD